MISKAEFAGKFASAASGDYDKYLPLCDKFYALTEMLIKANEKTNLTAIRDEDGIILKHYIDCLSVEKYLPRGAKLLDVGCGGGFPTLPLAIAREDIRITALDSTAKKLEFVRDAAKSLGLNVEILAARAENIGKNAKYREKFSTVTARAVSALNVLSELCLPLTAKGGVFIAMKGSSGHDEYEAAKSAISLLGGEASEHSFTIGDMQRYVYVIKKTGGTPDIYPRQYAKILKSPL